MRRVGHAAHMGEMRNAYLDMDSMILQWILGKFGGKV